MHPHLTTLYNLQLADTHLRRSTQALQALDWGDKQATAVRTIRQEALALAAEKSRLDAEQKQAETTLAAAQTREQRSRRRVDRGEIHNEHELEATEHEIVALRGQVNQLEETILVLMEQLETIPGRAEKIRAQEQALLRERERIRQASTREKARLESDIAAVTKRRAELVGQLPADLVRRYEQMRASHPGGLAVARVVAGACDACRTAVSASDLREIVELPSLVGCPSCGRYLYTDHD